MKTIDLRPAQILFAEKGKLSTLMIYRIATKFQSQSLSPVPESIPRLQVFNADPIII